MTHWWIEVGIKLKGFIALDICTERDGWIHEQAVCDVIGWNTEVKGHTCISPTITTNTL